VNLVAVKMLATARVCEVDMYESQGRRQSTRSRSNLAGEAGRVQMGDLIWRLIQDDTTLVFKMSCWPYFIRWTLKHMCPFEDCREEKFDLRSRRARGITKQA
jgi:hypothetical protein